MKNQLDNDSIKKNSLSLGKFDLSKMLTDEDECYGELILLG